MHIGVTGSTGFIGTALVVALEERGDTLTRFVRPKGELSGATVRWDPARSLVDDSDLRRAGGFDAVVHLAGSGIADGRWSAARKNDIIASRTQSTSLLVSALRSLATPTAVLASGSAIGFYGSRGDEVLDETSAAGTGFLADTCVAWEDAASPLRQSGTKVSFLRTGVVMNRRGGSLKKQLPLFRFGLGGPLAKGDQWLSPISLRDEIRAILWAVDHGFDGPINLVCPKPVTNSEFTRVLARTMHRPALVRVPQFGLNLALGTELTSEAVVASLRVTPKVLVECGFEFENPDTSSIVHEALMN